MDCVLEGVDASLCPCKAARKPRWDLAQRPAPQLPPLHHTEAEGGQD